MARIASNVPQTAKESEWAEPIRENRAEKIKMKNSGEIGWRSCVLVYTLLPGLLSPSEIVTIYQNSNLFYGPFL